MYNYTLCWFDEFCDEYQYLITSDFFFPPEMFIWYIIHDEEKDLDITITSVEHE